MISRLRVLLFSDLSAERKTSLGRDWHPNCLRCKECARVLTPGQHAEVNISTHYTRTHTHMRTHSHLHSQRQTDTETDRQTDRHRDGQTDRDTNLVGHEFRIGIICNHCGCLLVIYSYGQNSIWNKGKSITHNLKKPTKKTPND